LKIQMVNIYFSTSSIHRIFFLSKNTKISILGGILKFLKLVVFGQILAILGRLCCIDSG
jgi:hypothetical protein